jgi:hypothetical protein
MLFSLQIESNYNKEFSIYFVVKNNFPIVAIIDCRLSWLTRKCFKIRISKNRQHSGQMKKYKQRSTKHTHKPKDRVTRTPLKTGGELRCSERVSRSCSTSGTRRVNLVTNPGIRHEQFHQYQQNNRLPPQII